MNIPETWEDLAEEVLSEIDRQWQQWGEQNHPNGTGLAEDRLVAQWAKNANDYSVSQNTLTWRDILWEEVAEAFAETDPERLREELIQVAAVAVNWVNCIDRRHSA
jgi:hypothetical protein